jgi:hypothetical protein
MNITNNINISTDSPTVVLTSSMHTVQSKWLLGLDSLGLDSLRCHSIAPCLAFWKEKMYDFIKG